MTASGALRKPMMRSVSRTWWQAPWWATAAVIALVAFGARLWPVLAGGGLRGLGNYDDGVYFGSAVAFVHGQMPYRDFLLLHPRA